MKFLAVSQNTGDPSPYIRPSLLLTRRANPGL